MELKLNELEIRNFDRQWRYGVDWVTQYVYTSEKNLTQDEFEIILDGHEIYGQIKFIKKLLTFANGKKLYKHICEAVMY